MKSLSLPQKLLEKIGATDNVVDTTGLKAYGTGQWRAKRYGRKARSSKLYLAIDLKIGKLILADAAEEHSMTPLT